MKCVAANLTLKQNTKRKDPLLMYVLSSSIKVACTSITFMIKLFVRRVLLGQYHASLGLYAEYLHKMQGKTSAGSFHGRIGQLLKPTRMPTALHVGNGRGWGNPCGLRGRVPTGWGTGSESATRQL